jgi:predicted dehydrogenase
VPTIAHREALERAAAAGIHALVEKPMAATVADADAMIQAARRTGIRLQIGHVERFNPALIAARPHIHGPKFVEAHRLALFQPRSLDIDVVFDLMIHDVDLVLDAVGAAPESVSAVGVAVLSANEDIANARLEFADGCVANLTASRVSQDRLRRVRFFQDDSYLSVDLLEKSCEMLKVECPPGALAAARASGSALLEGAGASPTQPRSSAPAARPHPGSGATPAATPAGAGPPAPQGPIPPAAPVPLAPRFPAVGRSQLEVGGGEPLTLELAAFLAGLRGEGRGTASAEAGRAALAVAEEVRAAMKRRARQWALRSSAVS